MKVKDLGYLSKEITTIDQCYTRIDTELKTIV